MLRPERKIPMPGEDSEYTSESRNDQEDVDNSKYDDRLLPADERKLTWMQEKIKYTKQQNFPSQYIKRRDEILNKQ